MKTATITREPARPESARGAFPVAIVHQQAELTSSVATFFDL